MHDAPPPFNARDRAIWNRLFTAVPPEWRAAPPSRAMIECREFLTSAGARSVLDVGCGVGRWAIYLAKSGFDVSGSDFADNGLRHAEAWARDEGVRLRLTCRAITDVPFPGERFDAAVAALVLDNVSRDEMALAIECIRASLVETGILFCLFNPLPICDDSGTTADADNPTRGITQTVYDDAELRTAFHGFTLVDFRRYELGTRGLYLQRRSLT